MGQNFHGYSSAEWDSVDSQCLRQGMSQDGWRKWNKIHSGVKAIVCCTIEKKEGVEVQDEYSNLISGNNKSAISVLVRVDSQFRHTLGVEGKCDKSSLKLDCEVDGVGFSFGGSCNCGQFSVQNSKRFGGMRIRIISADSKKGADELILGEIICARGRGGQDDRIKEGFRLEIK